MDVSGQLHVPCRFNPGAHCIGNWVGLRAGLAAMK
jgi:hypothetical protein